MRKSDTNLKYPWIARRLEDLGLKKTGLAEAMALTPSRISEILKGTRAVSSGEAVLMARYLQLPNDLVLFGLDQTPAETEAVYRRIDALARPKPTVMLSNPSIEPATEPDNDGPADNISIAPNNPLISQSHKNQEVGRRLTALRESQKMTIPALAKKADVDVAVLEMWEKGDGAPTSDVIKRLEAALAASLAVEDAEWPSWPEHLTGEPVDGKEEKPNARPIEGVRQQQVDRSLPYIPVHGTSQGGPDGRFEFNGGETIDYIPRPVALAHAKNVYAMYVEGDSMSPVFEPGDPIVLNPDRPPRIGDYVCLFIDRGNGHREPSSYIKRLVRRTATAVIVEQFNPKKEMSFDVSEIQRIERVYRPAELLSV